MAHELRTKVVGVTFENTKRSEGRKSRQRIIEDAARRGRFHLELFRNPENRHDKNAISVCIDGEKIGHLPREDAATLAPQVDAGSQLEPFAVEIIGGPQDEPEDEPEDELHDEDWIEDDPIYGVRFGLRIKPPRRLP